MKFIDFKEIIKSLFPSEKWNTDIDNEVLRLSYKDAEKELILSEQEFNAINNKIKENNSGNSYELFSNNSYEVILIDEHIYMREEENSVNDPVNNICYKYNAISQELLMLMLSELDAYRKRKCFRMLPLSFMRKKFDGYEKTNILEFISEEVLRYYSLKISTENVTTLEKFRSYTLSYTYAYMFNRQASICPYDDIHAASNLSMYNIRNMEFDSPKKIYNPELISYYNEAISSTILPHKFLSFYHIIEYFYEKVFSEDQIKKTKEIIMDISFSYKRDKDIVKLIKSIQQRSSENDVAINEKNALSLLIQKHVKQKDFKSKLIERNGEDFISVLNDKVSFSDGNAIIFSDEESQFVKTLTDRIYKTRNSIVHSKESFTDDKRSNKYKRVRDDKELLQEIALIQVIAEIMINEDSKPI